tara:strand:+ start:220 stop:402 length:183 start_codon:yes stop_codon:yes gene_type:complete
MESLISMYFRTRFRAEICGRAYAVRSKRGGAMREDETAEGKYQINGLRAIAICILKTENM